MSTAGVNEAGSKRKGGDKEESESSSEDEAGPQPAAPGQIAEDSDTDGEAGPPAPAPVKHKKKRKLAHEKVTRGTTDRTLCLTAKALVQTQVLLQSEVARFKAA